MDKIAVLERPRLKLLSFRLEDRPEFKKWKRDVRKNVKWHETKIKSLKQLHSKTKWIGLLKKFESRPTSQCPLILTFKNFDRLEQNGLGLIEGIEGDYRILYEAPDYILVSLFFPDEINTTYTVVYVE